MMPDDDYDPTQCYAFIDPDTRVLAAYGYAPADCPFFKPVCNVRIPVAWDFSMEIGKWRYDESVTPPVWVPYP